MKVMQKLKGVHATLPAQDIDRAKRWYSDILGLDPVQERKDGTMFEIEGSYLFLYPSSFAGSNQATAATLWVDDVRGTVDGLRSAGVKFEQYDLPGVQWDDGVATLPIDGDTVQGAWFRDSEGNIIALGNFPRP